MRYLENLSIEEKAWECMRIELKDMEENPKDFGETTTQITKDYLEMISQVFEWTENIRKNLENLK